MRLRISSWGTKFPKYDDRKTTAKRYLCFFISQFSPAGHLEEDSRLDKLSSLLKSNKSGFFKGTFSREGRD